MEVCTTNIWTRSAPLTAGETGVKTGKAKE